MQRCDRIAATASVLAALAPLPGLAANTYYVAPTGSDNAAGTEAAPFASVGKAQSAASAGDTVLIRGGRFAFSGSGTVGVALSKSGSSSAPINYFAYPGETPVFDLTNLTPSNRVTGLDVHCNYIHLRGLEVTGVHQYESGSDSWGVRIQGNGNVLENLDVHNNDAPGIFITSGSGNLVLNCDSHSNYDYLESGGSGDGFGCHASGGNNVLRGCRAWDNSDDGFDFINAAGSCTVEDSFSFRNGWVPPDANHGTPGATAGNGAGFKAGGYGSPPEVPSTGAATHTVQRCVAVSNRSQGFYANHHPGQINFFNNTAYNNPSNFNMLSDAGYPSSHVIRNNVAFGTGGTISNLSGGTATFNSWNLSVTVTTGDFQGVDLAEALGPRKTDGSLPEMKFMHLLAGSDLIDVGTDVGLPFVGSAPDLGAFEYGGGASIGTGGSTGTGGVTGTAGAGTGGNRSGGAGGGTGGAGGRTSGPGGAGGTTGRGTGGMGAGGPATGTGGVTAGTGGTRTGGATTGAGTGGNAGGGAGGGILGSGGATGGDGGGMSSGGTTSTSRGGAGGESPGGSGGMGTAGAGGGQSTNSTAAGGAAGSTGAGASGCGCHLGQRAWGRDPSRSYALAVLALLRARWRRARGPRR
jgi:parallel beta-helix repeat protein